MIYAILATLILIAGISKAISDKISFHHETSVFKNAGNWFNPSLSWKNKYNWFPKSKFLTWIISNPLVLITDAWHFFGFLERIAIFSCLFFQVQLWLVPVLYVWFTIVFHVFFTWIFTKK